MGNVVPTGTVGEDPQNLLPLLDPELVYRANLSGGKLLKSVQCQTDTGPLVVKLYWRWNPELNLEIERRKLEIVRDLLSDCPNLCVYERFEIGGNKSNSAFLVRPFFFSNLYDRPSTLPFLSTVDKVWIAYQLLRAVATCHKRGVVHGDIKSENVMVTSWNWVVLSDVATFKPTYIPVDQPGFFHYFFASQQRTSCCLAPERLRSNESEEGSGKIIRSLMDSNVTATRASLDLDRQARVDLPDTAGGVHNSGSLDPSMDIFSVGCVIAELFSDGQAVFDYSELLRYSIKGRKTPFVTAMLEKIPHLKVREMVAHMLQYDAQSRHTAEQYLEMYTGPDGIFPTYMRDVLYEFMEAQVKSGNAAPDSRIWKTCLRFSDLVKAVAPNCKQAHEVDSYQSNIVRVKRALEFFEDSTVELGDLKPDSKQANGHPSESTEGETLEAQPPSVLDKELEVLKQATDEFASRLQSGAHLAERIRDSIGGNGTEEEGKTLLARAVQLKQYSNMIREEFNLTGRREVSESPGIGESDSDSEDSETSSGISGQNVSTLNSAHEDGIALLVPLLTANIRACRSCESKLVGLLVLRDLAVWSPADEVRLELTIPYVVALLRDAAPLVRCWALRVLVEILDNVGDLPTSDIGIIPEYIIPSLAGFPSDDSIFVQLTFAELIPNLAAISRRYLDMSRFKQQHSIVQQTESTESSASPQPDEDVVVLGSYDAQLERLHSDFENIIQRLISKLSESSSLWKLALLQDITRLCSFFGRERTDDFVLPILITFLNERDNWQLKASFFESIVGVCAFVGQEALEQFILPCIEQALHGPEELVSESAIRCLVTLIQMQLLSRHATINLIPKVCPLLVYPSRWIRESTFQLCASFACSSVFSMVDVQVMLVPHLEPLLKDSSQLGSVSLKSQCFLIGRTSNLEEAVTLLKSLIDKPARRSVLVSAAQSNGAAVSGKLEALAPFFRMAVHASTAASKKHHGAIARHSVPRQALHAIAFPHQDYATLKPAPAGKGTPKSKSALMSRYGVRPVSSLGKAGRGQLGSEAFDGSISTLRRRIAALGIPPLLTDIGALRNRNGETFSIASSKYQDGHAPRREGANLASGDVRQSGRLWKPAGVLVATLHQHSGPVNRIAVSQDHLFFATGSGDGSVCLWLTVKLDSTVNVQPRLTYSSQGGRIVDLCMIHNSHSIASASSNGSIHVFKVEHAHSASVSNTTARTLAMGTGAIPQSREATGGSDTYAHGATSLQRLGLSTVLKVDYSEDGAICAIAHFNSASQSVLVAATERGKIHAWDLRTNMKTWTVACGPQCGLITALAVPSCGLWMAVGTSRGVIMVWDIRYQVLVKAWWHSSRSPILRMNAQVSGEGAPLLLISAGANQVALFDVDSGWCKRVFKVSDRLPPALDCHHLEPLEPVTSLGLKQRWGRGSSLLITQNNGLWEGLGTGQLHSSDNRIPTIRAILYPSEEPSPFGSHYDSRLSSVITGGTDRCIRFWDIAYHNKGSYMVSGTSPGQVPETHTTYAVDGRPSSPQTEPARPSRSQASMLLCHPGAPATVLKQLHSSSNPNPLVSGNGPVPPHTSHEDSILDLKMVDLPSVSNMEETRLLLSGSRDGVVKVWR